MRCYIFKQLDNSAVLLHASKFGPFLEEILALHRKIIWQSYLDAILRSIKHNRNIIMRAEKYAIEVHNATSHNRGGWAAVNL